MASFSVQNLIRSLYALTYLLRGVVADSEDTIKASAIALGKQGFINYFGLQVLSVSLNISSPGLNSLFAIIM